MNKLLEILIWIIQFPQNPIGYLLSKIYEEDMICRIDIDSALYTTYLTRFKHNYVFGKYIFIKQDYKIDKPLLLKCHFESLVSLLTGPFYYIIKVLSLFV